MNKLIKSGIFIFIFLLASQSFVFADDDKVTADLVINGTYDKIADKNYLLGTFSKITINNKDYKTTDVKINKIQKSEIKKEYHNLTSKNIPKEIKKNGQIYIVDNIEYDEDNATAIYINKNKEIEAEANITLTLEETPPKEPSLLHKTIIIVAGIILAFSIIQIFRLYIFDDPFTQKRR